MTECRAVGAHLAVAETCAAQLLALSTIQEQAQAPKPDKVQQLETMSPQVEALEHVASTLVAADSELAARLQQKLTEKLESAASEIDTTAHPSREAMLSHLCALKSANKASAAALERGDLDVAESQLVKAEALRCALLTCGDDLGQADSLTVTEMSEQSLEAENAADIGNCHPESGANNFSICRDSNEVNTIDTAHHLQHAQPSSVSETNPAKPQTETSDQRDYMTAFQAVVAREMQVLAAGGDSSQVTDWLAENGNIEKFPGALTPGSDETCGVDRHRGDTWDRCMVNQLLRDYDRAFTATRMTLGIPAAVPEHDRLNICADATKP